MKKLLKTLWRLKKTVYGLTDAPQAWYRSVVGHVKDPWESRLKSNLDPIIFIWKTGKTLKGIMCSHVDNFFLWRRCRF